MDADALRTDILADAELAARINTDKPSPKMDGEKPMTDAKGNVVMKPQSKFRRSSDDAFDIAAAYNLPSDLQVWRTSVPESELKAAIDWSETINFPALQFLLSNGLNPSDARIRKAIDTVLATAPNTLSAVRELLTRTATRAEKLFASDNTLTHEGPVSFKDVELAFANYEVPK